MNSQADTAASHGEAMDRMYRWQRHIYDATRRYYLLGRDELLDRLEPPPRGSILEIGCGTGRNLIGAARRYPDAELFGIDISGEMLRTARQSLRRARVAGRVTLACADATSSDFTAGLGRASFDRIYFCFTLSMIPDWRLALDRAVDLLAPGGELHVADFGQCEDIGAGFRNLLLQWLNIFGVVPRADLRHALLDLAAANGSTAQFESRYRGYAGIAAIKRQPPPRLLENGGAPALARTRNLGL